MNSLTKIVIMGLVLGVGLAAGATSAGPVRVEFAGHISAINDQDGIFDSSIVADITPFSGRYTIDPDVPPNYVSDRQADYPGAIALGDLQVDLGDYHFKPVAEPIQVSVSDDLESFDDVIDGWFIWIPHLSAEGIYEDLQLRLGVTDSLGATLSSRNLFAFPDLNQWPASYFSLTKEGSSIDLLSVLGRLDSMYAVPTPILSADLRLLQVSKLKKIKKAFAESPSDHRVTLFSDGQFSLDAVAADGTTDTALTGTWRDPTGRGRKYVLAFHPASVDKIRADLQIVVAEAIASPTASLELKASQTPRAVLRVKKSGRVKYKAVFKVVAHDMGRDRKGTVKVRGSGAILP